MHRLKLSLLLVAVLVAAALGVGAAAALAAMIPGSPGTARLAAVDLSLHMSDAVGGPAMRTFVSSTNTVHAVVRYAGANNESYQVRLRDLVGIEVFQQTVRLNGDGAQDVPISVGAFVASYRQRDTEERQSLTERLEELGQLCASHPGAPPPTPQPTPGAPTATPDPFVRWRTMVLDSLVSAKTTAAEMDRTLKGLAALPDLAATPGAGADLQAAQLSLGEMQTALDRAEAALSPRGTPPGTPTPSPPPQPDPAAACVQIELARNAGAAALARSAAAISLIPADVSTWRLPATSAHYQSGRFVSCQPYVTELFDAGLDTAVIATAWTVGQPGEPALIFPGPDQVDRANLGELNVSLPEGAEGLYASNVTAPGANHSAMVSAFVTDAQCIPVDAVTMTFGTDPSTAGTVEPRQVRVIDGVASATLTAGVTATQGSEVIGSVCSTPGCSAPQATARRAFNVIGPVETIVLRVHPDEINPGAGERAGFMIRALDHYGRAVADGTRIRVALTQGSPGVLGRLVTPRSGTPTPEVIGKSAELVTVDGYGQVPPGNDPGVDYNGNLFLMAGSDGEGIARITAESDGRKAEATVTIKSRWSIHLPALARKYAESTPTPRRPRLTPNPQ